MNDSKECACSGNKDSKAEESNTVRELNTETMVNPDDFGKIDENGDGPVSEESVEESVVMINPDIDSMESRG